LAENETQGEWTLPDGWVWTTLGEITEPSKEKVNPQGIQRTPYVGLEHIERNTGRLLIFGYSDEVRSTKAVFQRGDLLYGKLRPYLNKVHIADFDGVCSTDILVFPKSPHISNRCLLYRLLSSDFVRYANLNVSGVQHPRTNFKILSNFPLALPPAAEQRRIVAEIETQFTRLDAGVAALERAQANLRRYKASVLKAACEGRLVPTEAELARAEGRDYEPAGHLLVRILAERRARWEAEQWEREVEKAKQKAAKAVHKTAGRPLKRGEKLASDEWQDIPEKDYSQYLPKDNRWKQKYKEPAQPNTENLPALPEGWGWASVAQLAEHIQYGYTESAKDDPVGPKFLRITDIQDGRVNWDTVPYCECLEEKHAKYRLEPGDIVFARTGATTGKSYLIVNCPDAVFASYLIRLQMNKSLNIKYLALFLDSPLYWPQIMAVRKGSAQPGVNATILATLHVSLPPLPEQCRIVAEVERRLSVAAVLEASVVSALARARRLRQAVLKQAFEGRLVEQDPSDEPASVLLERIKAEKARGSTARRVTAKSKGRGRQSTRKEQKVEQAQQLEMF